MSPSSEQVLLRETPGSRALLIAFADMHGGFGMRPGRFLDLIAPLPSHQLILTDPHHAWFLKGLPGIGDRPVEVARYLARLCRRLRAERVATVGNSAGAYAAILFGALLEVDEIHAFGPQTRLTRFRDARRYPQHIGRLLRDPATGPPFRDLAVLLKHLPHPGTRIFIHHARLDRLDRRRAERLRSIPSVTLLGRPVVGHELMRIYRENGLLPKLLTSAVTGTPLNVRREAAGRVPGDFVRSLALRVRDIHRRRFKCRSHT